jgi:hypothetical protein
MALALARKQDTDSKGRSMPDPARLLTMLRAAAQAFRDTPGRRGRFVALDDATEVFATGDLHGNVENFRTILTKADLRGHPRRHLVLQEFVHGPHCYPDGGDKSHQLLDLLAALKCQHPRQVHFLPGNHELSQATNRLIGKGDNDQNELFRAGVRAAYAPRDDEIYDAYLHLLSVVPLALRTANRIYLSHSLPSAKNMPNFDPAILECDHAEEADLAYGGSVHSLVWGRDTSAANAAAFLQKVDADLLITGHIPCEQGFAVPNDRQIILDSLGSPACYCLFPTNRSLTHGELVQRIAAL